MKMTLSSILFILDAQDRFGLPVNADRGVKHNVYRGAFWVVDDTVLPGRRMFQEYPCIFMCHIEVNA